MTDPKDRNQLAVGFIDDTAFVVASPTIEENINKLEQLGAEALDWSCRHACKFDIKKFQLVHFTQNDSKYARTPLVLNGIEIQASNTAKYLGIIMDWKLRWKEQVQAAVAKGKAAVLAVAQLTRPTFGMPHKYIRQLYTVVVAPKMEYGLQVWYEPIREIPDCKRLKGSVSVANQLSKVQRLAAILTTGALRSTAADTLDYHAFLPPTHIRLNTSVFNAAARLASLPASHPLYRPVLRCMRRYPHYHHSPLHKMFQAFPMIRNVETIETAPPSVSWNVQFTSSIAASHEEVIAALPQYAESLCIFTDRSGYEGGIGTSAVATDNKGQEHVRKKHLGSALHHTVFEGEVVGLILALNIIRSIPRTRSVTILADNQVAITAPSKPKCQPGRYLLDTFNDELAKLKKTKPYLQVHITWIPGHENVDGNERADKAAKEAAEGDTTPLKRCILNLDKELPTSIAALKAMRKKQAALEWVSSWKESPRAEKLKRFDRAPPVKRVLKLYADLPRREASLVTQLRTGHVGLNLYLHHISVADSSLCVHCHTTETVHHYLLNCQCFATQRHNLRCELKSQSLNLSNLLSKPKNIPHSLTYIHSTKRFPHYLNDTLQPST